MSTDQDPESTEQQPSRILLYVILALTWLDLVWQKTCRWFKWLFVIAIVITCGCTYHYEPPVECDKSPDKVHHFDKWVSTGTNDLNEVFQSRTCTNCGILQRELH